MDKAIREPGGVGDPARWNGDLPWVRNQLIQLGKAGITEYKALAKEISGYYGLFQILPAGVIRDSGKHAEMLELLKEV